MVVARCLILELFDEGISISSKKSDRTLILFPNNDFQTGPTTSPPSGSNLSTPSPSRSCKSDLKTITNFKPTTASVLLITVDCLIGFSNLDSGYLIFVTKYETVIENNKIDLEINKVKDVTLIPLQFEGALKQFNKIRKNLQKVESRFKTSDRRQDDTNSESDEDDDEDQAQQEEEERVNEATNNLDDIESSLIRDAIEVTEQQENTPVSETHQPVDFFVTNMGVLADSFKAQPQISVNNENIVPKPFSLNDDGDQQQGGSSIHRIRSSSYVKHNRVVTANKSILSLRSPLTDIEQNPNTFISPFLTERNSNGYHISRTLIKKFKRNVRHFFKHGGFYFSFKVDLTKTFQIKSGLVTPKLQRSYEALINNNSDLFWNKFLLKPLINSFESSEDYPLLIMPLIEGFIDEIELDLMNSRTKETEAPDSLCYKNPDAIIRYIGSFLPESPTLPFIPYNNSFQVSGRLILVSRRSTKRCGLRYMRRGIDDEGNVANFVETDQLLIIDDPLQLLQYRIIRGSIPLFFQQDSSKLQPIPKIQRSREQNREKFELHFQKLKKSYPDITCLSLIEKKNREKSLGNMFKELAAENDIKFVWFDFHAVCSKMRFENVKLLLDEPIENAGHGNPVLVEDKLKVYSYDSERTQQKGIFRINCIDCLDRTNIVSKFICEKVLQQQLDDFGLSIHSQSKFKLQYSELWANNGDYISTQYASTNALKGDFTRTERRKYTGVLNDGLLTLSRYYYGYFTDFYRQVLIDFLLGNSKEEIFEQFESSLTNLDPNLLQEKEIESKIILDNMIELLFGVNGDDEIVLQSWWANSNFCLNKVRRYEMKNIIFILTNIAIYFIDFKGSKSEADIYKVKIKDLAKINYGHYYNDTTTVISRNPDKNIGLRFYFKDFIFSTLKLEQSASNEVNDQMNEELTTQEEAGLLPIHGLFRCHSNTILNTNTTNNNSNSNNNNDMILKNESELNYLSLKFSTSWSYDKIKYTIRLISKICYSSELVKNDIVSLEEAKRDTPFWKVIDYELKKLIWA